VFWRSPFFQAELFCSLLAFQQEQNVILALTLASQLFSLYSTDSWIAVLKKGKERIHRQQLLGELEGTH